MKRSGPLQRKTALKPTGKIKPGQPLPRSTLPRSPMKRRPKFVSLEYRELRLKVKLRDGGCVAGHLLPDVECRGREEVHHLWRRSQGGPDEAWNLKTLCAAHHTWVHANIKESLKLDLLRRRGQTEPPFDLSAHAAERCRGTRHPRKGTALWQATSQAEASASAPTTPASSVSPSWLTTARRWAATTAASSRRAS